MICSNTSNNRAKHSVITDGVVKIEEEAEQGFEEILTTQIKYGKNDITLKRYLGYHGEIRR